MTELTLTWCRVPQSVVMTGVWDLESDMSKIKKYIPFLKPGIYWPIKRSEHGLTHGNTNMIFHLWKPGAGVEEVIVAAPVHHPRGLGHQPLLQEVSEAAGQDLPGPPDEVEAAGVKLPDHDEAGLQRQWLVLLPQQVASAGGRVLEVVRVDDTPHALPGGHQRPPDVQIPAEGIIVLRYRGPHHSLTAKIPGSVVDNVSGTENVINDILSPIIPGLMCHCVSLCVTVCHCVSLTFHWHCAAPGPTCCPGPSRAKCPAQTPTIYRGRNSQRNNVIT